ncbi:serine/threonine kinase family protein [Plesiocystis pacifica SIR-1]|uniref:Serine/threonine kinase family protein n=1 Tax=Plesiocystis pacifica SIR-1 TaxID=391625 RepID=A6GDW6_9BACT|nr:serine/threonine kinase family protein [Plesiocystis pacifica SIR-1]
MESLVDTGGGGRTLGEGDVPSGRGRAQIGEQLGRYVVLRRLGAGAMGVVFAAYDPELDRKVAIKLLRSPDRSSVASARLQREAQALAKLDHPNVVAVHDVGVHLGQVFVGMEFVAGQTLSEWLDEAGPGPRPWRELTPVFLAAGRGLAAAHAAGLIHRDFKPDNVMLGADGRVRVMDFGLARAEEAADGESLDGEAAEPRARARARVGSASRRQALADTLGQASAPIREGSAGKQLLSSPLTRTGAMMGTPAYMSLEQFDGAEVDARSDQFSFCAALYEALYGERPFPGETLGQLLAALEEGRVRPAPRGAASPVPAWLRRVVVRGLAPEPENRWPSMDALLEALEGGRARRRRWRRGAAVGLCCALAVGLGYELRSPSGGPSCADMQDKLGGVWDPARSEAIASALEATGLPYAEETSARVRERLDDYAERWVAGRVEACESTARGEQSGVLLDLRMACLDDRLRDLEAVTEVLAHADATVVQGAVPAVAALPRPEDCADLEALRERAGIEVEADPHWAGAGHLGPGEIDAFEDALARVEALTHAGKYEAALAAADALAEDAAALEHEPALLRAWLVQGDLQQRTGAHARAEQTFERSYAAALRRGLLPEAAEAAGQLVWVVGHELARQDEGRGWAKHAEPLSRAANSEAARAAFCNRLGSVAFEQAEYGEAEALWEESRVHFEAIGGPEHPSVATALNNLGNVAFTQGDHGRARELWGRALAIREQSLGPSHPDVAASLNGLGLVAKAQGRYADARAYYERALAIEEGALGREHPGLATTLNSLGNLAFAEADYERARAHHARALSLTEASLGAEHPSVATALNNLGNAATELGDYAGARASFEGALAIYEASLGESHPVVAITLDNLGSVALALGEFEQARAHHERALAIGEAAMGEDHPDLAYSLTGLGQAKLGLGDADGAAEALERALMLRLREDATVEATELAKTRFALARALLGALPGEDWTYRWQRAVALADEARASYALAGPGSEQALDEVEAWLLEERPE